MIKGVLFDFHGVMTDETKEVLRARMLEMFNFKYKDLPDELKAEFRKLDYDKTQGKELWKKMKEEYNIDVKGHMFKLYWIHKYFQKVKFHKDMYKFVKEIEKKGYKICLLSNTYKPFAIYVKLMGKYRPFKKRILSHEVGYAKPDKEIYELALKKIGLKASEVVFVDDRNRNLKGSEAVGIKGILFKNQKQLKKDLISLGLNL